MRILRSIIFVLINVQDWFVWQLVKNEVIHKILLSPGFEGYRWRAGRWRLYRTLVRARKKVPAYKKFYIEQGSKEPLPAKRELDFTDVCVMDKQNYIKKYDIPSRCWGGKVPAKGILVDESSGSSGTPTSWVRGADERRAIKQLIQVGFGQLEKNRPIFVLNAFAMGAWATGIASTMALLEKYMVKSTGPDHVKIIETMLEFGSSYDYVILGYPPFLRDLVEIKGFDFKKYNIVAVFGGEAMSESMRSYLEESYTKVMGSYGASDLEINIAAESEFTIALRKEILGDRQLSKDLILEDYGVVPMIFQYNPFEYVVETNSSNELLISICRVNNLNPRIRYNIHDLGQIYRLRDIRPILKKHGKLALLKKLQVDFPILLHYGRSDLSLDYYGAVVSPESIKQVIYTNKLFRDKINAFRLVSYEDSGARKNLLFAFELKNGYSDTKGDLAEDLLEKIIDYLNANNLDFKQACSVAERASMSPKILLSEYNNGMFERKGASKLKNEYIWNLNYSQSKYYGLSS